MSDLPPLPHLLSALLPAAGLARVLAFASEHGGRRLSVPKRAGDGHRLVAVLGREGADLLCALYGGETITVPMGPAGTLAAARMRMARALAEGASIDEAAGHAGLHRRTAQRMRARAKDGVDEGQSRLF
ncbi:Homeodomain-like domain-containing protein [Azorhizobium sp. AG788]|uniref:helix-turn-helix domain-containing protein n=1 Tax=Azorhizobium sp. AG788 TaxID=2183897 RepID=UPI00105CCA79|nr:helix-turn-helix domain-containing protein [Azorhizobium sp. AG788]TDT88077.1 Homeodomain-like domain-containing protein [Azorhizobium sp. AG788]